MANPGRLLTAKTPPQSIETERAILGCCLCDPDALQLARAQLRPADFFLEKHRRIFSAMVSIAEAGQVVDILTLSDSLQDSLQEVGGPVLFARLCTEAGTLGMLATYCGLVLDKAMKREQIRVGTAMVAAGYNGQPAGEVLAETTRELEAIGARIAPTLSEPVKPMTGSEISLMTVTEPDWMVRDLCSRKNQHMFVAASQGAKSWLLDDLAVCVAHPEVTQFLGQSIAWHGRALIESWENGRNEDVRRIKKLARGHGLAACSDDLLLISDPPGKLSDESYFTKRRLELQDWGITLYCLDSLSEAAGIDLNDNTVVSEWWRARIKPLLDDGVTVVWTHLKGHVKAGVPAADRDAASRGATQIRALCTGVLELKYVTDTMFTLRHNKHRDGRALPFGVLELVGAQDQDFVKLVVRDKVADLEGKQSLARGLLADLGRQAAGTPVTRKQIEGHLNAPGRPKDERVSKKTYEAILAAMVADGFFDAGKQGHADIWVWKGPADDDDVVPF